MHLSFLSTLGAVTTIIIANIPVSAAAASSNPACPLLCYNDGECVTDGEGQFHCKCPLSKFIDGMEKSFTGTRCETPSVTCKKEDGKNISYLCLNDGASCRTTEDDKEELTGCNCGAGFTGLFCENGPRTCMYGGVCYNGGKCNDRHITKKDKCNCPPNTDGERCENILEDEIAKPQSFFSREEEEKSEEQSSSSNSGFSVGALAGVTVGSVVGIVLVGFFSVRSFRRCNDKKMNDTTQQQNTFEATTDAEIA